MLREMGKEFTPHVLNLMEGEHKTPKILELNPFGKTPILKDGKTVLFESTAILNYLGEKFPESGLVPKSGTVDRAHYDQWTSFCTTELEQPLWRITKHAMLLPEAKRIPQDIKLAKEDFTEMATVLDKLIGHRKFLVGDRFTAADITLAYTLGWARSTELLGPFANCQRYLQEMTARPAFPAQLFAPK
jgi:glutathione S-transferase